MKEGLRYKMIYMTVFTAVTALFAFGIYVHLSDEIQAQEIAETRDEEQYVAETMSNFEIAVAGTVVASDSITVRAQTAGVIKKLFAEEGDIVGLGSPLLHQEVPLIASRIALQNTQNGLSTLSHEASYIAQKGVEDVTKLESLGASSTELLTRESGKISLENQTALLEASLYGSVTDLVATLDFIDENQQYFNAQSLSEFRNTVGVLYGNLPPYLAGSVQYRLESRDDVLQLLEDAIENKTNVDPNTLIPLVELIDEELTAVRMILIEGETEFLDARVLRAGDDLYGAYFDRRNSIVNAQTSLRTVAGSVKSTEYSNGLNTLSAETAHEVLNAQALTTALLAANAERTVSQSGAISDASLRLIYSEEALGRPIAPFMGTVGDVYVDEGEFVMPGTPLMTFIGSGARELKVTLPHSMLRYVTIGAPFIVDSVVVGHVERLTPTLSNGSATVVIGLEGGEHTVGEVLRGSIQGDLQNSESIAILRSYAHFDNNGAFVRTESGKEVRAEILHDTGEQYIMKLEEALSERVVKAVGIEL